MFSLPDKRLKDMLTVMTSPIEHIETNNKLTCTDDLTRSTPICGAASSQPIATIFGTWRILTDVINRAKFNLDRLRGFGWAGARKSHVCIGKRGRP
jgi:hypothetical protein